MSKQEAVIVGVADAPLEKGVIKGGGTPLQVQARCARAALGEAGMTLGDVGGLLASGSWGIPGPGQLMSITVGEYLGIRPRFSDTTNLGGSSFPRSRDLLSAPGAGARRAFRQLAPR